jgi:hypothetical protein
MIHYELRCSEGHAFDGWFRDSGAFEHQAAHRLVACPECGSTAVERALMAPAVPRKGNRREPLPVAVPSPPPAFASGGGASKAASGPIPAQVVALLQRMREEVEKNCDYVGDQFADEARKIHRGESEARGIYGESTPEQAEALAEEGIEVSQIPWVSRADG